VYVGGLAITPALFTSTCNGPRHDDTNSRTDDRSVRSSSATFGAGVPVLAPMSFAARSPASTSRTASVTSAPASASALAVSIPIPDAAPVTTTDRPVRSIPATTSDAVLENPNDDLIPLTAQPLLRNDDT
jgi:hypothetical protein